MHVRSLPAGRRLTGDPAAQLTHLLPVERSRLAADLDREADAALQDGHCVLAERLSARAADLRASCRVPEQLPLHDERRLRLGSEHLIKLGPRLLTNFLMQLVQERRDLAGLLELLDQWRARLTPEMVRASGAHRFPPPPLREVRR